MKYLIILNDPPYGTELVATAHRSGMAELTDWTLWADKVLVL